MRIYVDIDKKVVSERWGSLKNMGKKFNKVLAGVVGLVCPEAK